MQTESHIKNELSIQSLSFSRNGHDTLKSLDFTIHGGEMIGLIGPNGAGKSTLLKILIKLLKPNQGNIDFQGRPFAEWTQKVLAQQLAYLPQNPVLAEGFSAFEVVLMGRYTRLGRFEWRSKQDDRIAEAAMKKTESLDFAHRLFTTLSGGEQQRVLLARALAQEATLLLLDEPTASLDLHHQLHFFKLLQSLVQSGQTVFMAIHDLNLAARFCERLILLHQGKIVADGTPQMVLTAEHLLKVYGVEAEISHNATIDRLSVLPLSIQHRMKTDKKKAAPNA